MKENKNNLAVLLTVSFLIVSTVNILYASVVQRGLSFDGSLAFAQLLENFGNNDGKMHFFAFLRARVFISYLQQLLLNVACLLFNIKSKTIMGFLFTLPFFLYPLSVTVWNWFLVKRTNRYDIFLISLGIYCLFVLPSQIWADIEAMLAIPLFLTLFHYLCADIKYKKLDIALMIFLTVVAFCSSEAIIYCGPLMFLSSLFYAKKSTDKTAKIIKRIIGLCGLLMPVSYFFYYIDDLSILVNEGTRFFGEINFYMDSLFYQCPYLIMICAMVVILYASLKKKPFNTVEKSTLFFLSAVTIYLTFTKNYFSIYMPVEGCRVLLFIVLPIVMIFVTAKDFKTCNAEISPAKFQNLIITLLLVGIVNTCVQINNSTIYRNCLSSILNQVKSHPETIVDFKDETNPDIERFDTIFITDFYPLVYISTVQDYEIDQLLYGISNKSHNPENAEKMYGLWTKEGQLYTNYRICFSKKNKFWNLEKIYDEAEKNPIIIE